MKYNRDFWGDDFGGLGDQPLDEQDFLEFSITKEEFEIVWKKLDRKVE